MADPAPTTPRNPFTDREPPGRDAAAEADGSPAPRRVLGASAFALMAGLLLGLVGVGLALLGNAPGANKFVLREVGISFAGLAVPLLFLGHLLGHQGRRWHRTAAWFGLALCALGVLSFSLYYPDAFNVPEGDRSLGPIVAYALGLSMSAAASFAALVADYARRLQAERAAQAEDDGATPLSKADIQRDIDEAMGRYRWTWGGMREGESERRIRVRVHDVPELHVISGRFGRERTGSFAPAGQSLERLSAFRGGRMRRGELNPEPIHGAAAALRALRENPDTPAPPKPTLWQRVRAWLGA